MYKRQGGCEGTQYGCCPNSDIAKHDESGSNCNKEPEPSTGGCEGTQYGCCPNSDIAKNDESGSNCNNPQNQTNSQNQSNDNHNLNHTHNHNHDIKNPHDEKKETFSIVKPNNSFSANVFSNEYTKVGML